jgi:hypothetical protein
MRFEDEQYVRLYKRDTTTWLLLPWQARCILPLVLKACDRAGIIDLGEDGWEGLAAIIKVPTEVVDAAMPEILKRGVLIQAGGLLVWPKFIEAQEVPQSDRVRAKASRERARDLAMAANRGVVVREDEVDPNTKIVTFRDEPSQTVTNHHATNEIVTLSCADLCSEENIKTPCRLEVDGSGPGSVPPDQDEPMAPISCPETPNVGATTPPAAKNDACQLALTEATAAPSTDPVVAIYEHHVAAWRLHIGGARPPILDVKRRKAIADRLREKFSVADLKSAVEGIFLSPFHMGDNKTQRKYTDITLACRDAEHVEKFCELAVRYHQHQAEEIPPESEPIVSVAPPPEAIAAIALLAKRTSTGSFLDDASEAR